MSKTVALIFIVLSTSILEIQSQVNFCSESIDKSILVKKGKTGKTNYYEINSCRIFLNDSLDNLFGYLFSNYKINGECFLKLMEKNCYESGYYKYSKDSILKSPDYLINYFGKYVTIYSIVKLKRKKYIITPETCFISKGVVKYTLIIRKRKYKLKFYSSEI